MLVKKIDENYRSTAPPFSGSYWLLFEKKNERRNKKLPPLPPLLTVFFRRKRFERRLCYVRYSRLPSRGPEPGRCRCPAAARRPGTTRRLRSGPELTEPSRRCRRRRTPAPGGWALSYIAPGPCRDRRGSGRTPVWGSGATGISAAASRPGYRPTWDWWRWSRASRLASEWAWSRTACPPCGPAVRGAHTENGVFWETINISFVLFL